MAFQISLFRVTVYTCAWPSSASPYRSGLLTMLFAQQGNRLRNGSTRFLGGWTKRESLSAPRRLRRLCSFLFLLRMGHIHSHTVAEVSSRAPHWTGSSLSGLQPHHIAALRRTQYLSKPRSRSSARLDRQQASSRVYLMSAGRPLSPASPFPANCRGIPFISNHNTCTSSTEYSAYWRFRTPALRSQRQRSARAVCFAARARSLTSVVLPGNYFEAWLVQYFRQRTV